MIEKMPDPSTPSVLPLIGTAHRNIDHAKVMSFLGERQLKSPYLESPALKYRSNIHADIQEVPRILRAG